MFVVINVCCPDLRQYTFLQMKQQGISLFQKYNTDEVISKTWILLDSCSTDIVFKNPDLVTNIRTGSADE